MKLNKLYIVSTPIGNYEDITLRALRILKSVDFIICEEIKPARRLLSEYRIEKELIPLNEHSEKDSAQEIIEKIRDGKSAAQISDCGTPLFSDPGHFLLELAIQYKIDVVPIPGVVSLIPALTMSSMRLEKFHYYGWLSPKKEIRRQELNSLKKMKEAIVILDTPYRLAKLLDDVKNHFGPNQEVFLAYKITMEDEKYLRGNIEKVISIVNKNSLKGEFVLIINNRSK